VRAELRRRSWRIAASSAAARRAARTARASLRLPAAARILWGEVAVAGIVRGEGVQEAEEEEVVIVVEDWDRQSSGSATCCTASAAGPS